MKGRVLGRNGVMLLAVAVIVVATLVAIPAAAFAAKATTRLVAVRTMTVDNGTLGVTAWPVDLVVKLQKRVSGSHYHALSGTVKLYLWSVEDSHYDYVTSKKGSTVTFKLPSRGKYKLYYSGTSKLKSATAYTTVYESIGAVLSSPAYSITPVEGSAIKSWVNMTYYVNWNTEAWDGPVTTECEGELPDGTIEGSEWVYFERELWAPGTVELNFKVLNTDLVQHLMTYAKPVVGGWWDEPYILPGTELDVEWDLIG